MTEHFWDEIWDIMKILIPLVIGIPISAYISLRIQRHMKKEDTNDIISNTKESLKDEIKQTIKTLSEEDMTQTKENDVKGHEVTGRKVKFLVTASFESSVNSGNFNLLDKDLRTMIGDLYAHIHLANFKLDQLIKSQFTLTTSETKETFNAIRQLQMDSLKEEHEAITKNSNALLEKL